jgi:acyl dehydratase
MAEGERSIAIAGWRCSACGGCAAAARPGGLRLWHSERRIGTRTVEQDPTIAERLQRRRGVKKFKDLAEFVAAEGTQLGPTEWLEITQDRVNLFADATEDHQWIHVDPARAADGPFGGTIAHGLLTLSLLPHFTHQLYSVDNVAMAINYGYNKVRFITPVRVGAKLRARAEIAGVAQLDNAVQATLRTTVEIEGSEKPAAVAESIVRFIG